MCSICVCVCVWLLVPRAGGLPQRTQGKASEGKAEQGRERGGEERGIRVTPHPTIACTHIPLNTHTHTHAHTPLPQGVLHISPLSSLCRVPTMLSTLRSRCSAVVSSTLHHSHHTHITHTQVRTTRRQHQCSSRWIVSCAHLTSCCCVVLLLVWSSA